MRTVCTAIWAVPLWCMLLLASGLSASPPSQDLSPQQLQAWVEQLDDESYAHREAASENLHAAGGAAIEALAAGSLAGSPETAWRAGETLKRIAIAGNDQTLDRVAAALEKLGQQGQPGIHQVVAELRARQKQMRHDRAAAQIRKLGGQLAGGLGSSPFEEEPITGFDPAGFVPAPLSLGIAGLDLGLALELEDLAVEAAGEEPKPEVVEKLEEPAIAKLDDIVEELFAGEVPVANASVKDVTVELTDEIAEVVEAEVVEDLIAPVPADVVFMGEFIGLGGFGGFGGGFVVAGDGAELARGEALALGSNWRGGDAGLAVVRDLPEVTRVEIRGAKLTDAALEHLAALPKLARIDVQGTKFSDGSLRKLRRAKPEAFLYCQGNAVLGIHADERGDCVLTAVLAGSGAFEGGLREGDRIRAVDGQEIRDFSELTIAVYARQPQDRLKVEFERDGKVQTAEVVLKPRAKLER
ncbi:MAG: PDZ domain-containing protein [Pirellulaceae bacterium]